MNFKIIIPLFFFLVIACNDFYIVFEGNVEDGITALGIQPKGKYSSIDSILICNSKNIEVCKHKWTHQGDTLKGLSYFLFKEGEIETDSVYKIFIFSNKGVSKYEGKVTPNIQFE